MTDEPVALTTITITHLLEADGTSVEVGWDNDDAATTSHSSA